MKIRFGGAVADARGSEGGRTITRTRGGAAMRRRVSGINPQSARQTQVRARLTALSKAWGSVLTTAQRNAWKSFAQNHPITDIFGETIILTGEQAYVRLNGRGMDAGQPRIDDPPPDQAVDAQNSITVTAADATPALSVAIDPDPVPADHVLVIRATGNISPGISYVKQRLRTISTVAAATAGPYDALADWQSVFGGDPIEARKIAVQAFLLNTSTYGVSQQVRDDAIVAA